MFDLSRDTKSAPGRHTGEKENPALAAPLGCNGTPEELDAELGCEPAGRFQHDRAPDSTLAAANAEMIAVAKVVQKEARKKAKQRKKKQGTADLGL